MSDSRILIAGTNSGCGKTTVTCALMKALMDKGLIVAPFKCGPDYIDPMFHKHITGRASVNLDLFFTDGLGLKAILERRLAGCDIGVIEGVMGLYDGIGTTWAASAFDVALQSETPIVLVLNARGMSLSVAAEIEGFKNFGNSSLIKGVILNRITKGAYTFFKAAIEERTGVKVLGYMPQQADAVIESRHLGLITADEIVDLDDKVSLLAKCAANTVDLDGLLEIASTAAPLHAMHVKEGASVKTDMDLKAESGKPAKLAVALDKAFCFYYDENFELFKQLGIDLEFFSPLNNEPVPEGACGIYIGGGYPEVYAKTLSDNERTRLSVSRAYRKGMPIVAECGGFMYLHDRIIDAEGEGYPMCGIIPGAARMTKKLGPFGYVKLRLTEDCLLGRAGAVMRGHEFHYSVSDNPGGCIEVSKSGGRSWTEGYISPSLYAAYPHLYFPGSPESALYFKQAMIEYDKREFKL